MEKEDPCPQSKFSPESSWNNSLLPFYLPRFPGFGFLHGNWLRESEAQVQSLGLNSSLALDQKGNRNFHFVCHPFSLAEKEECESFSAAQAISRNIWR